MIILTEATDTISVLSKMSKTYKKKTVLLKESIDLDAYEFVKKGIESFLNPIMKNGFKYTSVVPNGVGNPKKFSSIMYLKDPNLICYKVETKISPNLNKNFTAVEVSLYKKSYEKFSLTGFLAGDLEFSLSTKIYSVEDAKNFLERLRYAKKEFPLSVTVVTSTKDWLK